MSIRGGGDGPKGVFTNLGKGERKGKKHCNYKMVFEKKKLCFLEKVSKHLIQIKSIYNLF